MALIGQSEDAYLDCKEWPSSDPEGQKTLAKGACGLTNAEGGVLIIGMRARPISKDEPDLVETAVPVQDTSAVKSRILDLIGQLVEPRIQGVQVAEVNEPLGSKSGFVIVHIPASEGPPRRSRKDWKFYQRIGSGTFPMEYFQIEERFGRRPPPKLELYFEPVGVAMQTLDLRKPARYFVLGLRNDGRSLAKFPSVRYRRASGLICDITATSGIDGCGNFGLPLRPSEPEWVVFRGGIDDVIYPQELRRITKLWQDGSNIGPDGNPYPVFYQPKKFTRWDFKTVSLECEISCEGASTSNIQRTIDALSINWP